MSISSTENRAATLKRWLGVLLVLFIFYGTTVEAAHWHGKTPVASNHGSALVDPDSNGGIFNAKPGCNDCLICQLHQNFSATLISFKLSAQPLVRRTYTSSSTPVLISSISHSPQSGRAPPQAN